MSKCVIKVGKLYYSGTNPDGTDAFVSDITKACEFDTNYKMATVEAMATEMGGVIVGVVNGRGSVSLSDEEIKCSGPELGDTEAWFVKNIPYILNCTGATNSYLAWYNKWVNVSGHNYDMTQYLHGIPSELRLVALQPKPAGGRYVLAFMLVPTVELSPEQLKIWNGLKYGIPLVDNRRLLRPTIAGLDLDDYALVKRISKGGGRVVDTEERFALVKQYEAERKAKEERAQRAVKHSLKATGLKGMNLF